MVYTKNNRVFDWDPIKADKNARKHGVSFELGTTVFDDPDGVIRIDFKHSSFGEVREQLLGLSNAGILVVVFTLRDGGRFIRLISVRRANQMERKIYEKE